jgi:hypothetical protein
MRGSPTLRSFLPSRARYSSEIRGEASPTLCYGELTRRGQDFFSNDWPTDERCEPLNDTAKTVVAYYQAHRANPRLPRTAWDAELGRLNEIPHEHISAKREPQPQPRLYTRDT